jgi:hypothetical protein
VDRSVFRRGTCDRGIWTKPLAFAADAGELMGFALGFIIAVIDSVHAKGLKQTLVQMGMVDENIVTWSTNGVEFVYPSAVLDEIYGGGGQITVFDDVVSRNGSNYTKVDLADRVCARVTAETPMSREFDDRFLSLVTRRIG